MKIRSISKALLVITFFALAVACKKDKGINKARELTGSWTQTPLDAQLQRTIFFGADGSLIIHDHFSGNPVTGFTSKGTYRVEGDQLILFITERITKTPGFAPVVTNVNQVLFDKATFSISGNKLIINYTSYPADGPVPTSLTFVRN